MCSSVTFICHYSVFFFYGEAGKIFYPDLPPYILLIPPAQVFRFPTAKKPPSPPLPQKKCHHSYFQKWWLRFHFCVDIDFIKISDYNISFKIDECHYRNRNMSYSYILCQFRRLFWAQTEKPTSVRCEASRREASCKSLTPPRVPPLRWRRPYDIVPTIYILLEVDE